MTSIRLAFTRALNVASIAGALMLAGCGYTLQGKVVGGTVPGIEVVHQSDPRLRGPGINNAEVLVRRDPESPNRTLAGRARTGGGGEFATSVDGFGAGWMEEQWLVQALGTGFQNTQQLMKLPPSGGKWHLLITMTPGTPMPVDDPLGIDADLEQFE